MIPTYPTIWNPYLNNCDIFHDVFSKNNLEDLNSFVSHSMFSWQRSHGANLYYFVLVALRLIMPLSIFILFCYLENSQSLYHMKKDLTIYKKLLSWEFFFRISKPIPKHKNQFDVGLKKFFSKKNSSNPYGQGFITDENLCCFFCLLIKIWSDILLVKQF